jgi:hypothetical protein
VDFDHSRSELAPAPRLGRTLFKWTAIALVSIAMFYLIEEQIGERVWRRYQREAAEKGLRIRLADFETPEIPDEENFAAVPILQGLFRSPNEAARAWAKFNLPPRKPAKPGSEHLAEWQQAFVLAAWIPRAGENSALDVLVALQRLEPELNQIRVACRRPKTSWPLKWSDSKNGPGILTPLSDAGRILSLRAESLLRLGRSDEAFAEIQCILRIADSLNDQPETLYGCVRNELWNSAVGLSVQGLSANQWSSEQISSLVERFGTSNHLAQWRCSLIGDRCGINEQLDVLMAAPSGAFVGQLNQFFSLGSISPPLDKLLGLAPRGWIRRAQANYNRIFDAELEDIDSANERLNPLWFDRLSLRFGRPTWIRALPSNRLSDEMDVIHTVRTCWMLESYMRARQFPILCAIHRYANVTGQFPKSLDQLTPACINAVPLDIIDGHPMRYRRMDDGGCKVWSIGTDQVDNGGETGRRSFRPDWVSGLPPLN